MEKQQCEIEKFVSNYFGRPETDTEDTTLCFSVGEVVNMLHMFRDSEVKDIAIAFAVYAASQWPRLTDEELFSDFITNYYKVNH